MYSGGSQRGAVLIVSLVFLLVLTILGVTGIRTTVLQETMAGGFKDEQLALQGAEAALRHGEYILLDDTGFAALTFDGSDGLHVANPSVVPFEATKYGIEVPLDEIPGLAAQPTLYIEELPEFPQPNRGRVLGFQQQIPMVRFYRVTAKGVGLNPNTEVILQSNIYR